MKNVGFSYSDLEELPVYKRKYHIKKMIDDQNRAQHGSKENVADRQEMARKNIMEKFNVRVKQ